MKNPTVLYKNLFFLDRFSVLNHTSHSSCSDKSDQHQAGNRKTEEPDVLLPDFVNPLVFLFIDFNLCKSAGGEQTNSPRLSVPSEALITYHVLGCAKLIIMSGVACNGCVEYTTEISSVRCCLSHNNQINSISLGNYFGLYL